MSERQMVDQQQSQPPSLESDNMMICVSALETALLPCLPARELQAVDRSPHPFHQSIDKAHNDRVKRHTKYDYFMGVPINPAEAHLRASFSGVDVESHARDFMEAVKKLQLYFIRLHREDPPTKIERLRKVSFFLSPYFSVVDVPTGSLYVGGRSEEEDALVENQERLIQELRATLKGQLDKLNSGLDRV